MILDSIKQIIVYEGEIIIEENGNIIGAPKVRHENGVLTIGERSSGMSSNSFTFVNGSIIGGSHGTVLSGPRSTPITINGVKTTYGEITDSIRGIARVTAPVQVYEFADTCKISTIEMNGGGKILSVAARWLASNLTVNVRGSGNVQLPEIVLNMLNINIAGSGDVVGQNTNANILNISVAGSGDVRSIHANGCGSVSVAGSGDVNITASHPSQISKNIAGSGDITVGSISKKRKTS